MCSQNFTMKDQSKNIAVSTIQNSSGDHNAIYATAFLGNHSAIIRKILFCMGSAANYMGPDTTIPSYSIVQNIRGTKLSWFIANLQIFSCKFCIEQYNLYWTICIGDRIYPRNFLLQMEMR